MSPHRMTLAQLRQALNIAVDNTLEHPEMVELVTPFGYSQEVLEAVQAQVAAYGNAKAYKHARYGAQKAATKALKDARRELHREYMKHVTIARRVLRDDPGALTRLGLNGPRATRLADWKSQVSLFYNNALNDEDLKARLTERNLTEEDLIQGRDRIGAIRTKKRARANKRGLAQQSTADRDDLRVDLAEWLADYYEYARIAFSGNPEWLERIGLLHRST